MFRRSTFVALCLPLAIAGAGQASAAGIGLPQAAIESGTMVKQVHSVYEAEDTLRRRREIGQRAADSIGAMTK